MALPETTLLAQLLGVSPPWTVSDVRISHQDRNVIVTVEQPEPAGTFWRNRKPSQVRQRLRWDHTSLAGLRCELVVALRDGQSVPAAAWTGEVNMPFTRALTRLLVDLMLQGATIEQLSNILALSFTDLWKFKFRLDQGEFQNVGMRAADAERRAAPATTPVPAATAATVATAATTATAGAVPGPVLPPESSPVWQALLMGRVRVDVRALSLKLLLSKLLREAQSHTDADLHQQAAQSLRRYFERHAASLTHEVEQVVRLATQMTTQVPTPAAYSLPDVSDPLWLALLQGDYELEVRTLSLRLLLSRLRSQLLAMRDDDLRMLKLVELHRFFEKNQATLRHEIAQLQRWSTH